MVKKELTFRDGTRIFYEEEKGVIRRFIEYSYSQGISDDDEVFYCSGVDSRYDIYNGYNGYDDDTIDIGFDGFTKATWNVD